MAGDLFKRLAAGRPLRQSKSDNSELARELQRLHEFLQRWNKSSIICLRDIYRGLNYSTQDRKNAIGLAEVLTGHGWLIPDQAHRHDRRVWRIVRAHGGYPTSATVPPAPSRND
jgi:hypothetical protein